MPRSATLDDLEPPNAYYEPVMWVQRPAGVGGARGGGGCHPCCCSQQYRFPTAQQCHGTTASLNGSLPRYHHPHAGGIGVQNQDYIYATTDYNNRSTQPPSLPPSSIMREFRSHSVASDHHNNINSDQQVYLSMTRTKRVVVIPINNMQESNNSKNHVVQIPLTATSDGSSTSASASEYATSSAAKAGCIVNGDPTSKVVSMGNKTCISVNESSLVSTKAIVHQPQQSSSTST